MSQHNLTSVIDAFPRLNVLIIGEAMLDSYLEGPARRICREAPVPIVDVEQRTDTAGGAANTAVNAAALGCNVQFLSVVGEDVEGAALIDLLQQEGVETEHVFTVPGRQTLAKHRVVASSQLLLRFDQGTTERVGKRPGKQDRLRPRKRNPPTGSSSSRSYVPP